MGAYPEHLETARSINLVDTQVATLTLRICFVNIK